jgi:hypothetical protein
VFTIVLIFTMKSNFFVSNTFSQAVLWICYSEELRGNKRKSGRRKSWRGRVTSKKYCSRPEIQFNFVISENELWVWSHSALFWYCYSYCISRFLDGFIKVKYCTFPESVLRIPDCGSGSDNFFIPDLKSRILLPSEKGVNKIKHLYLFLTAYSFRMKS